MLLAVALWPRGVGLDWMDSPPSILAGIVGFCMLAGAMVAIPSQIAQSRGHPNAAAISMCSIVGVVFLPAWFVALVWAYTSPRA